MKLRGGFARACLITSLAVVLGSCVDGPDDSETVVGAVGGSLSISGQVIDAAGLPRSGVTITLAGSAQGTRTTNASGNYSFTNLAAGSYSVRPTRTNCSFVPDVVNLNNMTTSKVQNFVGSGSGCGGTQGVNSGATEGPFAISGRVTDASGRGVVGAQINLSGGTTAVRFTDFSGRYQFRVGTGGYSLAAAGACALTPGNVSLGTVNGNRTQNFSASGSSCVSATPASAASTSSTGQFLKVALGSTPIGTTIVRVEPRTNAAEANARLTQILQERSGTTRTLTIAGNPAVERQVLLPTPELEILDTGPDIDLPDSLALTTAVAIGATVVRFESRLAHNADATTINRFLLAGRNLGPENVSSFRGPAPPVRTTTLTLPPAPPSPPPILTATPSVSQIFGELQVAAAEFSGNVVIGTQVGPFWSFDHKTVQRSNWVTVAPTGASVFRNAGDPSMAIGPWNGTTQSFYMTQLAFVTGGNPPAVAIGLFQSTDEGATFNPGAQAFPLNCFNSGTCVVPDQAQIAVDKWNRANVNGVASDQIYLAWRNFAATASGGLAPTLAVACSADGGSTWTFDYNTFATTGADIPRLTVARDGSFYVAYAVRGMGEQYSLQLQKFASCASGFAPATGVYPVTIATPIDPTDMAGMPRQPFQNYTAAASDLDPALVYIAYTNVATGFPTNDNDNVHVAQWSDTQRTVLKDVVINTSSAGHRYFPAICTTGNNAFVSWYDRRVGGTITDDRTAYFRRILINEAASLGAEVNVSGAGREDPQCQAGFPGGGSDTVVAETLCPGLPNANLATGSCQLSCPMGTPPPCGSTSTACDLRPGAIGSMCSAMGETCQINPGPIAPGNPTFGDYNGSACARGQIFMAWASTTSPQGACTLNGMACATATDCCSGQCNSGICAPSAAACLATGSSCTTGTCCSGNCQGGICFRQTGVFMSTGSRAMFVRVTGTADVVLTDNLGGTTTRANSIDQTFPLGLDTRTGGFTLVVDPTLPLANASGGGFELGFDNTFVKITGLGFTFGPTGATYANDGTGPTIYPGLPFTHTNSVSTGFTEASLPYVGGEMHFSYTFTPSQEQ